MPVKEEKPLAASKPSTSITDIEHRLVEALKEGLAQVPQFKRHVPAAVTELLIELEKLQNPA